MYRVCVCVSVVLRYLTVLLLWYNPHNTYPNSYTAPIIDSDFDSESLISISTIETKWSETKSEVKFFARVDQAEDDYTLKRLLTISNIHTIYETIYTYMLTYHMHMYIELYLYYHIGLLWQLCVIFQTSWSIKQSYHISLLSLIDVILYIIYIYVYYKQWL